MGDLRILDRTLIGFFCSVRCPGDIVLKAYDLARALRSTDLTLIGGFQLPMEKECLDLLLRGSAAVVVCPARAATSWSVRRNGGEGKPRHFHGRFSRCLAGFRRRGAYARKIRKHRAKHSFWPQSSCMNNSLRSEDEEENEDVSLQVRQAG